MPTRILALAACTIIGLLDARDATAITTAELAELGTVYLVTDTIRCGDSPETNAAGITHQHASLIATMKTIDTIWDPLSASHKRKWRAPRSYPAMNPEITARYLTQLFEDCSKQEPRPQVKALITKPARDADKLTEAVAKNDKKSAKSAFKTLKSACFQCHKNYRKR
jgi:hypothetical protein